MIPTKIRVGLALLALVACKEKPPEMAKVTEAFPKLPLPPNASLVSQEGSADAVKLTLKSNVKPAVVEAYYRAALSQANGWRLVSDSRDAEGATVLLAEQDGPPLWVRIVRTSDSAVTMVELAGGVVSRHKASKRSS